MNIRRLNHAVLFVARLERAHDFYRGVLGFETVAAEERLGAVFLRARGSQNHHDLGLFGVGEGAPRPAQGQVGLYHLAWQVPTIDDLAAARDRLVAVGALAGESSHGVSKSLYGSDPDGNGFEIMWLVPREAWGEHAHRGTVAPLDLAAEVARWSGVATC